MIEEQKGNISEIAYSLVFQAPTYFTRCFKEEYGYVPSQMNDRKFFYPYIILLNFSTNFLSDV